MTDNWGDTNDFGDFGDDFNSDFGTTNMNGVEMGGGGGMPQPTFPQSEDLQFFSDSSYGQQNSAQQPYVSSSLLYPDGI